jgi:Ca2+/Na+ antiporter
MQNSKASSIKLPNSSKNLGGFNLYVPAIIALVGYIVMAIVILLPFEYPMYDEKSDKTYIMKYNFGQRLLSLLLMTIPIILSVYTINCMMVGQCLVWSYVVSISTVLWIAMFVLSAMIYTWTPKE